MLSVRILLATDKFKGSLTADAVNDALRSGLVAAGVTGQITSAPVADGGDGTLAAALRVGFDCIEVDVVGPTGKPRRAAYGRRGTTALVELASVCGLALLGADRFPMSATSAGLGLATAAALDAGAERVVLGIGGSASTDGGAGMLSALGAQLQNSDGRRIGPGGGALADLASIDLTDLHPRLSDIELVVASDVDNPLCGRNGAAAVYARQKGAAPEQVQELDHNLARLASIAAAATGVDHSRTPGAGAAGGVGFAALLLGASLRSGIEMMLELTEFHRTLAGVDLVITGEGSLDEQTLAGKAPAGVAAAARARGIPVVAVAGRSSLSAEQLQAAGIGRVYTLSQLQPDLSRSIKEAAALLKTVGTLIGTELLSRR